MTELEKSAYAVVMASCKLRHYFEAFKVRITSDRGLGELFRNPEASVRIAKWAAELSGYHITFEPRTTIKSQVLADFIIDWIGPITQPDTSVEKVWTIHCDGAWCHAGAGAAAVITSPTGVKHRYAARLSFALESDRCTNNIAGYEAVILSLRKLRALGVTTCIIRTYSTVVTGQVEKDYAAKDPALMQYLAAIRSLERQFKGFTFTRGMGKSDIMHGTCGAQDILQKQQYFMQGCFVKHFVFFKAHPLPKEQEVFQF
jgi:ribonuclease HI